MLEQDDLAFRRWRTVKTVVGGITALLLVSSGCSLGSISFHHHDDRPVHSRRVLHNHVCNRDCHDHYYDGQRVVVIRDRHRHGPECGHHWDGRHWMVVKKGKSKVRRHAHVHGDSCGCAFEPRGNKWVKIREGHVHSRHCGHVHKDGRWTIRH
jgi:hypothetical protein